MSNPIDASSNCEAFTWYTTGPNPNSIPPGQYPIPNPPRVWTRFSPKCPGPGVDFSILDMRRKAEILQFKQNSSNMTKNQIFSMTSKNSLTRKKAWASQTQDVSIPNNSGLPRNGDSIFCPSPLV